MKLNLSSQQLKDRYSALSTEELVEICVTSDLPEFAIDLILTELKRRSITDCEIEATYQASRTLSEVRKNSRQRVEKRTWGFAIGFLLRAAC